MLQLHLAPLVEEYKFCKVHLQSMLPESKDTVIQDNPPDLNTGRKGKVTEAMQQLHEMAQHTEVRQVIIDGRAGVGLVKREWFWYESSSGLSQVNRNSGTGLCSI